MFNMSLVQVSWTKGEVQVKEKLPKWKFHFWSA